MATQDKPKLKQDPDKPWQKPKEAKSFYMPKAGVGSGLSSNSIKTDNSPGPQSTDPKAESKGYIKQDSPDGQTKPDNRFVGTVAAGGKSLAAQAKALAQTAKKDVDPKTGLTKTKGKTGSQYAEPSSEAGSEAAQDFLKEKLVSNRYLMGEGELATGQGYEDQMNWSNENEINKWEHDHVHEEQEGDGKTHEAMLSAEEIREKFGLNYVEEHDKEFMGKYGANESQGSIHNAKTGQYIGTMAGYSRSDSGGGKSGEMRLDKGIAPYEAIQNYGIEHGIGYKRGRWSSINDVAGAANDIHGADAVMGVDPELEAKSIEHSEEIRQAKERVENYEEGILSGETSEDIFDNNEVAESKYNMDLAKGADGIGTAESSNSRKATSEKAAVNFLQAKLGDTKKEFNFKPS